MAKRIVQECDLTKAEYDPAETVTLIIKKNGKKTGRTYELSSQAAAKLEQQLVSGSKLPDDWSFVDRGTNKISRRIISTEENLEPETQEQSDEELIAAKHAARVEAQDNNIEPDPVPLMDPNVCLHRNKSRTHMKMDGEKRVAYKICKDCRNVVPVHKRDERVDYATSKVPSDINLKDREK